MRGRSDNKKREEREKKKRTETYARAFAHTPHADTVGRTVSHACCFAARLEPTRALECVVCGQEKTVLGLKIGQEHRGQAMDCVLNVHPLPPHPPPPLPFPPPRPSNTLKRCSKNRARRDVSGRNREVIVESVMPDFLHVIPIRDDNRAQWDTSSSS